MSVAVLRSVGGASFHHLPSRSAFRLNPHPAPATSRAALVCSFEGVPSERQVRRCQTNPDLSRSTSGLPAAASSALLAQQQLQMLGLNSFSMTGSLKCESHTSLQTFTHHPNPSPAPQRAQSPLRHQRNRSVENFEAGKATATSSIQVAPNLRVVSLPWSRLPTDFVAQARTGLLHNREPELCSEGAGGTYFLCDVHSRRVAVFKPHDEDPISPNNPKKSSADASSSSSSSPSSSDCEFDSENDSDDEDAPSVPDFKGILPGEGALREVLAYQLDQGFAGVPETHLVECSHPVFFNRLDCNEGDHGRCTKYGSLQKFVEDAEDSAFDYGPVMFDQEEIHRIGLLDCRMVNCDRHAGNMLVKDSNLSKKHLIPIDHSFSLPSIRHLEDLSWFGWMAYPQAKRPLSQASKDYVAQINLARDVRTARSLGIRDECIRTLILSTVFLKAAVAHGLTLFEIGQMMCQTVPLSAQKTKSLGWLAKQACDLMDNQNELMTLDSFAVWATEQVESLFEQTGATALVAPSVACTAATATATSTPTTPTIVTTVTTSPSVSSSATALMGHDVATASACVTALVDAVRSVSPRVGLVMSSN